MKDISTLIKDINHVLRTGEGYTDEIADWVAADIALSLKRQFSRTSRQPSTNLRLSGLGTPCDRKLWYSTRGTIAIEPLPASTLNKFIFGDITESHILGLAKAAGHRVEGLQDTVVVYGIKGHRDCIIDGMLIDVKSASSRAYEKFKSNSLRGNDAFGYISQISSYLAGSQDDPLLTEKSKAGFLAFDKQFGHICLDVYDLTDELANKEDEINQKKAVTKLKEAPARPKWERLEYNRSTKTYEVAEVEEDWEHQKSGNRKLSTNCSYCDYKHECWPNLRTFVGPNSILHLTKVVKEPTGNVMEITK